VAFVDQLLEAAEEGKEPRLIAKPMGEAEREHDVRPERRQRRFPACIGIEIDPPELGPYVECDRGLGGGLEDQGVAIDRERCRRAASLSRKTESRP
jgi:hypothetical protein